VIAAANLEEGVRWCEQRFGVRPEAGGVHPLMGTHNRLLKIAGPAFPRAYLEIIAVDPQSAPARSAGQRRWFDLDDAGLQARLAADGPRLLHFVAEVADATAALQALAPLRIDRGRLVEASRDTPAGRLAWRITVRDDGQRLFYGALPTLIEWGPVHPSDTLGDSGVALRVLSLSHPRAGDLDVALRAIGLDAPPAGLTARTGAPNVQAVFDSPRGPVVLDSLGI